MASQSHHTIIIALLVISVALQGLCLYNHRKQRESYCASDSECPSGKKCSGGNCVLR